MHMQMQVARPEAPEQEKGSKSQSARPQWRGKVAAVRDIEENFWSPRLGMKGKIDLTVETVEPSGARRVLPLEIKTGKPSYSTSHQGQVIIYCMMSADRWEQPNQGLLLYLGSSSLSEVAAGRNEQRGLVQLRNELVSWLRGRAEGGGLPEPISHGTACAKCGYLGVCGLYQQEELPAAPHPMAELVPTALAHLAPAHVAWFRRWVGLLDAEAEVEDGRGGQGPALRDLWLLEPAEREVRGQAAAGLLLETVEASTGLHTFARAGGRRVDRPVLAEGELITVSTDSDLALASGPVISEDGRRLVVQLERDLTGRGPAFCADRFLYQGGQAGCYTALARLMADTPAARRLREAVVELAPPGAAAGLSREVARRGRQVMKQLNKVQQKTIFRSLMCERYSLIRGMPGSGKTTTIVSLVRLMALLGQSVLVVAYTNSAVDTILAKLVAAGQPVLRLGRRARVREEVRPSTAEELAKSCASPEELRERLHACPVVGTTCLGTEHAATAGRLFDWCVLDEASQAVLPSSLAPLLLARRFVLVGDPAQLPPTVRSQAARKGGLDQSLFSVLAEAHPAAVLDLHLQYRMNGRITALANHLTYGGKLACGNPEVEAQQLELGGPATAGWVGECLAAGPSRAVVWLDTLGRQEERQEVAGVTNPGEAVAVAALVGRLVAGGVAQDGVGVIAPYSAQVKLLKATLGAEFGGVEVGTVDQFQGRDKLVILYSCTRSNAGGEEVKAGHILGDTRRLNVAVTRAKAKLVIIGDRACLARDYAPFRRIEAFFEETGIVRMED